MSEIPTTIDACKARLHGTTIVSVDESQMTLKDNGNRYYLNFMKFLGGVSIIPHQKTCKVFLPAPEMSRNIPDAIRKFAKELNIKDPDYWLQPPKKRRQLLASRGK